LSKVNDCGNNNIFDNLIKARKKGLLETIKLLSTGLNQKFTRKTDKQVQIGESNYSTLSSQQNGKVSVLLKTKNYKGGVIHINHLNILANLMNNASQIIVEVTITKLGSPNTILDTYELPVKMNNSFGFRNPSTTLQELPEDGTYLVTDGSTYEISYQLDRSVMIPYDNNLRCVVCPNGLNELKEYFTELPTGTSYGLCINARFFCNSNYMICALTQPQKDETLRLVIAEMVVAKTLEVFFQMKKANMFLGASVDNVLENSDDESMIEFYAKMFTDMLDYLTNEYHINENHFDCLSCRMNHQGQRIGLLQ
jgi:hypothetical protein